MGIGIEFADQGIAILFSSLFQVRNERFNRRAAGIADGFRSAKVCGVEFHQVRIELELPNDQAELVAKTGLGSSVAV